MEGTISVFLDIISIQLGDNLYQFSVEGATDFHEKLGLMLEEAKQFKRSDKAEIPITIKIVGENYGQNEN